MKFFKLSYNKYFNSKYFDKAQATLEQTCFESYDPDIYDNVYCEEFTLIDEVEKTETKDKTNFNINSENKTTTGLTTFEDYNNRGDVVGLLESKGWRVGFVCIKLCYRSTKNS